jgi:hypothetical protein
MHSSCTSCMHRVAGALATLLAVVAGAPVIAGPNLLVNGGFEQNNGVGTVPPGWDTDDELFDYLGWIAPRIERQIGSVMPRSGRFMIGLDSEQMGIDSNGMDYDTPRAAIRQTISVPGGTDAEFQVFYNDVGSTGLAYISVIRLAYSINSTDVRAIRMASKKTPAASTEAIQAGVWSRPFHRVSQQLSRSHHSTGDWTPASIRIRVPPGQSVKLTVWIGIFDNQNGTEVGYWRVDDASLRPLESPATKNAPAQRKE